MANTNPVFALTVRSDAITLNTATTGVRTDGSTGSTKLMDSGASGTKITQLYAKSKVANASTPTAMTVFIYIGTTAGGAASAVLFDEITLTSIATSTTVPSPKVTNLYNDFQLPTGWSIWVSASVRTDLNTAVVPNVVVGVMGGDF